MTGPEPARCRTTHWTSCNRALKQRGPLPIRLDKDMAWRGPGTGGNGRPALFSGAAIRFRLMVEVLFGQVRQTTGMAESILSMAGLDRPAPDLSTLSRRQKRIPAQISNRCASAPLNLLVDSPGIKFPGDGDWLARKHGTQRRRQ